MTRRLFSTTAAVLLAIGSVATAQQPDQAAIRADLQRLLDTLLLRDTTTPGLALHVEAPRLGMSWTGTAGVADRATKAPLTPQHAYRMASNTKTYVAAAVLKLWEQGRVTLDRPIGGYLSAPTIATLTRGGYDPGRITVRHLLTHTSGVFDWGDAPEYGRRIEADPKHRWSRAEQLGIAVDFGKPYGAPGEIYRYSDTGYNLLGEIIERLTKKPWAKALRETVGLDALGLTATWLESLEPKAPEASDRAHQYWGPTDTYDWDPSLDLWGGGGLAATLRDMAAFTRGLFTWAVYRNRATADTMLTTIPAKDGPPYWGRPSKAGPYRMGIVSSPIEDVVVHSHGGFWGTFSSYVPEWDLAIAGAQTQQQSRLRGRLEAGAIRVLKKHLGSRVADWNAQGGYQWEGDLSGIVFAGTATAFKRPDGTWSGYGTFGGATGQPLIAKDVGFVNGVLSITLAAPGAEGPGGGPLEITLTIRNSLSGLRGSFALVGMGGGAIKVSRL